MRKFDLDKLKETYIGKTFNWLTVLDVSRIGSNWVFVCRCKCGVISNKVMKSVISGNTKSCGCRIHSKEKMEIWRKSFETNNSRDKMSTAVKMRYELEPSRLRAISDSNTNRAAKSRASANWTKLLKIAHPKYHSGIISGELTSGDIIETLCPRCNRYTTHKINSIFIISTGEYKYGSAPICRHCFNAYNSSKPEKEIADYISTFYDGELIRNSKNIISPLELDLYYPEKKIAIEFNGDYWHSELFKDRDYHYNKFKLCKENNIILVSIFESEWNNRRDEIFNYLKDLFSGVENKLSYNEDSSLMNNNYPLPRFKLNMYVLENYYTLSDTKVFTCGYSKI